MPIGTPTLKQLVSEIRYSPTIIYHAERISVCYRLNDIFPHWNLDIAKVEMYDTPVKENSGKLFSVTNRGASILQKNVADFAGFRTLAERIFNNVTQGFRVNTISRVGIRFFYLANCEMPFESFKEVLCRRIYNQDTIGLLAPNLTDLAFVANFTEHNTNFHLIFGPVKRDELKERFAEPQGQFFDVGLMVDLDCFITDTPLHRVHPFLRESFDYSQNILRRVIRFSEVEDNG